jgi:hypothetical protein
MGFQSTGSGMSGGGGDDMECDDTGCDASGGGDGAYPSASPTSSFHAPAHDGWEGGGEAGAGGGANVSAKVDQGDSQELTELYVPDSYESYGGGYGNDEDEDGGGGDDDEEREVGRSSIYYRRSSYGEGTPHCRFRRKPMALGAGQIHLYVLEITFYLFRIEPMYSHFDRNALVVELWDYPPSPPLPLSHNSKDSAEGVLGDRELEALLAYASNK